MKKKVLKRLAGLVAWLVGLPIGLFLLLATLLYIPPIQQFLVNRVAAGLSESLGMRITVERVRLAFPLDLVAERVLATEQQDTLLAVRSLRFSIPVRPLLEGRADVDGFRLFEAKVNSKELLPDTYVRGTVGELTASLHGVEWRRERIVLDEAHLSHAHLMVALSDTAAVDTTPSTGKWLIRARELEIEHSDVQLSLPGDSMRLRLAMQRAELVEGHFDTGRNYYADIVMRALGLRRRGQRDATDRANVWAFRVLAVAFVALVVLVCRLGLEWPFALITVFLMLLSFVVVARISAETGLFFIQPRWTIFGLLTAGLGSYVFSPTNQVICGLVCVMLCIDQCHALLPYVTNGMRLCERSQVSPSRVGVWTFAMYAVCVVAAVLVLLVAVYEWGVPQRMDWSYKRLPTMTFRTALPEINQLKAVGSLEAAETQPLLERLSHLAPREDFLGAFAFGLVAVGVFSFLRLRLPKWPLHPVMFLLWATYPMEQTCHAFLIGWLLKKCTLRFGGVQMVRTLQPLMIGVIGGELMAAIVFMIVGVVYYACTGEVPKVYRWFPR